MPSKTKVTTYSGYKADEYPKTFELNGIQIDVIDIEDRWYDPSYDAFRVFAGDGMTYLLYKWNDSGEWDLEETTG